LQTVWLAHTSRLEQPEEDWKKVSMPFLQGALGKLDLVTVKNLKYKSWFGKNPPQKLEDLEKRVAEMEQQCLTKRHVECIANA